MNCGTNQPFEIFTGQDKTISLRVIDGATGLPLDLTDCTEIIVSLPNADGTFTNLALSDTQVLITSPAILGGFTAPITNEVSSILNVGVLQSFNVSFTISGLVTIVNFFQGLNVLQTNS